MAITYPPILTNANWQKEKGLIAKIVAGETGIGAALTKLQGAFSGVDVSKLNASGYGKLHNDQEVDEAFKQAKGYYGSKVEPFRKLCFDVSTLAKKREEEFKKNAKVPAKSRKHVGEIAVAASHLATEFKSLDKEFASFDAMKQQIVKAKQDYAKKLKEYGDKKTALLNAYQSASPSFTSAAQQAEKLAAEADQAAVEAGATGSQVAVQKAEVAVGKLEKIVGDAQKKEADLLKIFDPHRSGEKPASYGLEKEDAAPFASVFVKAEALRKQFSKLVGEMEASLTEAKQSVAQAQTATLSSEKRLVEYAKLAGVVKANAEKAFAGMKKSVDLQGIVGKDLAGQMNMWADRVKSAKPEEVVEGKKSILGLARTRLGQVDTNEALMLSAIAAITRGVEKGAKGIPEKVQKESPEVKVALEGAAAVVAEAKKYQQEWDSEKKKGLAAFKELEKVCA